MKKGFTLVELIAVIIILGLVSMITFPIVNNILKESKNKAYEENVKTIENAALKYSSYNELGYNNEYQILHLEELKNTDLLKNEDIINPKTDGVMQGCILYRWDSLNKQYEIKYSEECKIPE